MLIFELHGFTKSDKGRQSLFVEVSEPVASSSGDFFCTVRAPFLFQSDKDIYGVDAIHAAETALQFLQASMQGLPIFDEDDLLLDIEALIARRIHAIRS